MVAYQIVLRLQIMAETLIVNFKYVKQKKVCEVQLFGTKPSQKWPLALKH